MRLWLIARREVWEKLQSDKHLLYDPSQAPAHLQPLYDWMRKQMAKHLLDYQGNYPWWAWARWTREKPMPDLRSWDCELNYFAPEESAVRLEVIVPDEEVLCSDFASWCSMLVYNGYVAKTQLEAEQWEHLPPAQRTKDLLEQSWESIFDLDQTHWNVDWRSYNPTRIQATFEHLRLSDVRRVTHFRCRYRKKRR